MQSFPVAERFVSALPEFGSGLGAAWSPGVHRAAVPLQIEFGLRHASGTFELTIGARERVLALIGSGSPPADAHNTIQLVFGLGFLR